MEQEQNPDGGWMVFVEGKGAPTKVHSMYEYALDEAYKLAKKELGRRVRVMQIAQVFVAKPVVVLMYDVSSVELPDGGEE